MSQSKPLWISMAHRLVLIAQRDLARKARKAATIKAMFSLERRVTLKLPKEV